MMLEANPKVAGSNPAWGTTQMKKQISLEEAKGKVLTNFSLSSISAQAILVFGDEFVCLAVKLGHELGDEEIHESTLNPLYFGSTQLIESTVMTKEEFDALIQKEREESQKQQESRERFLYFQLKKKYENT